jgi:predicted enzyme related to lactoylglutathione lyase
MARVVGLGGIFFKARDPAGLARWYGDVLGVDVQDWGGAQLRNDGAGHPPYAVWCPFRQDTDYFAPSTGPFMINLAVDDMDGMIARVQGKGVEILGRADNDPNGRFTWLLDPEGIKIELWEPKR